MKKIFIIILLQVILIPWSVWADHHDQFKGEAREDGKLVYVENHDVTFDDAGNALEATTTYVDPNGKTLGVLKSDFRQSLNLPEHVFQDERTKNKYGIRRENDKIVLFSQDNGKPEVTRVLESNNDKDRIQIGCQGFNYYLKGKVDSIRKMKSMPVLFMVPGDLSTYKFVLNFVQENADQIAEFNVKIENIFLRMFASELEFRYDQKKQRIVWYKGISNIKNDEGKVMNVVIDYKY